MRRTRGALGLFPLLLPLCALTFGCGARVVAPDPDSDRTNGHDNTSVAPGTTFTSTAAPRPAPKPNEDIRVYSVPGEPGPARSSAADDCALVGTFAGESSCCGGSLCAGNCHGGACSCNSGGSCAFPSVCCESKCVGPDDVSCRAVEDRTKEPLPVKVSEGNTCNTHSLLDQEGGVFRTCCNGALCRGLCVTRGPNDPPHCECLGVPGGAPAGMECCWRRGYVMEGGCNW